MHRDRQHAPVTATCISTRSGAKEGVGGSFLRVLGGNERALRVQLLASVGACTLDQCVHAKHVRAASNCNSMVQPACNQWVVLLHATGRYPTPYTHRQLTRLLVTPQEPWLTCPFSTQAQTLTRSRPSAWLEPCTAACTAACTASAVPAWIEHCTPAGKRRGGKRPTSHPKPHTLNLIP